MGRPVHTITEEARIAFREYMKRNPGARTPIEQGEWRIVQSNALADGGVFLLGIYKHTNGFYGRLMERMADSLRGAICQAIGKLTIVEILYEEEAEDGGIDSTD